VKSFKAVAAAACISGLVAAGAAMTKAQYLAKLRAADARFLVMARTHIAIRRSFAAIRPPKAAVKGNADFAHAEILFREQNEAIARKLPATKAAIVKYLHSVKPPSGGTLLDRAIGELHAAGFKI
jgi:hypothetical protein